MIPTIHLVQIHSSDPIRKSFNSQDQPSIILGRGARSNNALNRINSGLFRALDESTKVMSKVHASLTWQDGHAYLQDMNSTNGTFLQKKHSVKQQLTASIDYKLDQGDLITFGRKLAGQNNAADPICFAVSFSGYEMEEGIVDRPSPSQLTQIRALKIGYGLSAAESTYSTGAEDDLFPTTDSDEGEDVHPTQVQPRAAPRRRLTQLFSDSEDDFEGVETPINKPAYIKIGSTTRRIEVEERERDEGETITRESFEEIEEVEPVEQPAQWPNRTWTNGKSTARKLEFEFEEDYSEEIMMESIELDQGRSDWESRKSTSVQAWEEASEIPSSEEIPIPIQSKINFTFPTPKKTFTSFNRFEYKSPVVVEEVEDMREEIERSDDDRYAPLEYELEVDEQEFDEEFDEDLDEELDEDDMGVEEISTKNPTTFPSLFQSNTLSAYKFTRMEKFNSHTRFSSQEDGKVISESRSPLPSPPVSVPSSPVLHDSINSNLGSEGEEEEELNEQEKMIVDDGWNFDINWEDPVALEEVESVSSDPVEDEEEIIEETFENAFEAVQLPSPQAEDQALSAVICASLEAVLNEAKVSQKKEKKVAASVLLGQITTGLKRSHDEMVDEFISIPAYNASFGCINSIPDLEAADLSTATSAEVSTIRPTEERVIKRGRFTVKNVVIQSSVGLAGVVVGAVATFVGLAALGEMQ